MPAPHAPIVAMPPSIVHGTADPIFPLKHGELLAEAVEGAELLRLEGGGDEVHPEDWDEITSAIDPHIGASHPSKLP